MSMKIPVLLPISRRYSVAMTKSPSSRYRRSRFRAIADQDKICAAMPIGRLTEPVVDTLVGRLAHVIFRLRSRDESAVGG